MPPYRTGDAVEVTLFNSRSEATYNVINGIVFANKMRNNIRSSFFMHTVLDNVQTSLMIKEYSPMVAKVDIVKYGSNKLRKKMNHVMEINMSKNRLKESIRRGKGYKHRLDIGKVIKEKKKSTNTLKGRANREQMVLDDEENYADLD